MRNSEKKYHMIQGMHKEGQQRVIVQGEIVIQEVKYKGGDEPWQATREVRGETEQVRV